MLNPISFFTRLTSARLPRLRFVKIGLPLFILFAAFGVVGLLKATKPEVKARPVVEKQWSVSVIEAQPADIRPRRRFYDRG